MCAEPIKGGKLARQAAMLCQDRAFQGYLDKRRRHKQGLTEAQLPDGTHNADDARDWLCAACQIQSRAELDHDHSAADTFRVIRSRYHRWRAKREVLNEQQPSRENTESVLTPPFDT